METYTSVIIGIITLISMWLIPIVYKSRSPATNLPKLNPAAAEAKENIRNSKKSKRYPRFSALFSFGFMAYCLLMLTFEALSPEELTRPAILKIVFYVAALCTTILLKTIVWAWSSLAELSVSIARLGAIPRVPRGGDGIG